MRRLVATLILSLLPGLAQAHDAPSREELVDEMRGISRTLRKARLKVDDKLAVDERSALEALNHAVVAYFSEEYGRAAVELTQLVSRPGIKVRKSYPEALEYLGESLAALGLLASATEQFRESLVQSGQLPSQFARRVTRLLRVGAERVTPAEARSVFRRLTAMQSEEDARRNWAREARYEFGRTLHRAGEYDESDQVFATIVEPADPRFLHALYYLGVSQVARGELVVATEAFNVALEAYESLAPDLPGDREEYLDVDVDGDAREWVELELTEEEVVGSDEERRLRRIGTAINLALARLAAARDDDATAFTHYRAIPPGDPDHAAALSEATFVLFRRGKFAWCARMVDQLLAGRGDDLSAAQLSLWKGQLLARADQSAEARAQFRTLADKLDARMAQFAGDNDAKRIFPASTLAWAPPEASRDASMLEANYVEQEEALAEANAMLTALRAVQQNGGSLPAVADGRQLSEKLQNRMELLAARLDKAQATAHKLDDPEHEEEHPEELATLGQIAQMRDSYSRLTVRLQRYGDRLGTFDARFRKKLDVIVRAEMPNLERYATELRSTRDRLAALSTELRGDAEANIDTYAAEARFGEVDVAYWRKEAISAQISDFIVDHNRAIEPLNDVQREANALGIRLEEGPDPNAVADESADDAPDDFETEEEPAEEEPAEEEPAEDQDDEARTAVEAAVKEESAPSPETAGPPPEQ